MRWKSRFLEVQCLLFSLLRSLNTVNSLHPLLTSNSVSQLLVESPVCGLRNHTICIHACFAPRNITLWTDNISVSALAGAFVSSNVKLTSVKMLETVKDRVLEVYENLLAGRGKNTITWNDPVMSTEINVVCAVYFFSNGWWICISQFTIETRLTHNCKYQF